MSLVLTAVPLAGAGVPGSRAAEGLCPPSHGPRRGGRSADPGHGHGARGRRARRGCPGEGVRGRAGASGGLGWGVGTAMPSQGCCATAGCPGSESLLGHSL